MAQGNLKVKSKLPTVKTKSGKDKKKDKKGLAVQRRGNAPVQPKKLKLQEARRLKTMISKTVNKAMESELREVALEGKSALQKKNTT